jgi:hypothetical protein
VTGMTEGSGFQADWQLSGTRFASISVSLLIDCSFTHWVGLQDSNCQLCLSC